MRLTIENCKQIYIGTLQKTIRKLICRDYPDSTDEEMYKYTEGELLRFVANEQNFQYTAIKNRLGGYRWFFLCPKCNERVSKLFLPPPGYQRELKYYCKNCHKLKNQSAVMGQNKIYRKVTRPVKRMKEIELKLERGYLSNDKVTELLNEYEALEKELKKTPEYRLYMFKKQHGMDAGPL